MCKTVWAYVVAAVILLVRLLVWHAPSIFVFTLTCANLKLALMQGVTIFIVVAQFAHATAFLNVVKFRVGIKVNHPSFFDLPTGVHKRTLLISGRLTVLCV
jgi:hypothetical protein